MRRSTYITHKPWGTEEVWASTHHSVGKILCINRNQRLSRKYHRVKDHVVRVLEGILSIEVGPLQEGGPVETISVFPGEAYHVSAMTIHRFCAGSEDVRLLELSHSGPSDSVRLEDDYRRITQIPTRGPQSDK
jgi:mannose-6-phosphate isomerase-like protein (cupin superfamily)